MLPCLKHTGKSLLFCLPINLSIQSLDALCCDDIKVYDETSLISYDCFLAWLLYGVFYANQIKQNLSYEKKQFLIRKVQHKIQTLKKGELVPYESISTL